MRAVGSRSRRTAGRSRRCRPNTIARFGRPRAPSLDRRSAVSRSRCARFATAPNKQRQCTSLSSRVFAYRVRFDDDVVGDEVQRLPRRDIDVTVGREHQSTFVGREAETQAGLAGSSIATGLFADLRFLSELIEFVIRCGNSRRLCSERIRPYVWANERRVTRADVPLMMARSAV